MATSEKKLSVEIYTGESDTLGIGSYGKVCKAKCGQLPCAAKLLHDTMFGTNDPGIHKFVGRFEQECQFLRAIKHPNIVQFLGTSRDPRSQRLALLMELMDESLAEFLERSTSPLPYHTQLNICQDVALALAYLHSNDIIHRDLSSNNVLLIGEGSRAKVTDFGMSKLVDMNPQMTPLSTCPGTPVYMPPEALSTPPQYSSKLDCFSHGVLTIQIATRQYPNPGDANKYVEDPRYPAGRVLVQFLEVERRKKDIDLVAPDHPLLPLALHCLKDRDTERPSANELCGKLATLKGEPEYTQSAEQYSEQSILLQLRTLKRDLEDKEAKFEQAIADCQTALQVKTAACEKMLTEMKQLHDENCELKKCIQELRSELELGREVHMRELETALQAKTAECENVIKQLQDEIETLNWKQESSRPSEQDSCTSLSVTSKELSRSHASQPTLEWRRQGVSLPPVSMTTEWGVAVVDGSTAYFSCFHSMYSYSLLEDKWTALSPQEYKLFSLAEDDWTALSPCECKFFSLAVVNGKLTTIGGIIGNGTTTNTLLSLSPSVFQWRRLLPSMPTPRVRPAAVTTPTHLVVAGGRTELAGDAVPAVELLNVKTLQWSSASSAPNALQYPHMALCDGYLYMSQDSTVFSCSLKQLLKPPSTDSSSVWTRLADIPVPHGASLAALRGHVLAIGGRRGSTPTGAVHCYDRSTDSWSVIGEIPTPRYHPLVAVLPSNEVIVVGGCTKQGEATALVPCDITEIAQSTK